MRKFTLFTVYNQGKAGTTMLTVYNMGKELVDNCLFLQEKAVARNLCNH